MGRLAQLNNNILAIACMLATQSESMHARHASGGRPLHRQGALAENMKDAITNTLSTYEHRRSLVWIPKQWPFKHGSAFSVRVREKEREQSERWVLWPKGSALSFLCLRWQSQIHSHCSKTIWCFCSFIPASQLASVKYRWLVFTSWSQNLWTYAVFEVLLERPVDPLQHKYSNQHL